MAYVPKLGEMAGFRSTMSASTFRHKALLIIEEDPDYCELLSEAINRQEEARSASIVLEMESALALLQASRHWTCAEGPRLILLDRKPQDSREFIRHLRLSRDARRASVPVALMIASDDPRDIIACRESGADGYVVKPDTFAELVALIAGLCRYGLSSSQCFSSPSSTGEVYT